MATVQIACIGKLKEKHWRDAQAEYVKRLNAFCTPKITEIKEAALPGNASAAQVQKAMAAESDALLSVSKGFLVALSPEGKSMTSEQFADMIKQRSGAGHVTFAVGGSHGLSDEFKRRAGLTLSFSAMTMPHQLFRIVLLEQIYRGFMIAAGRTYHK